MPKGYLIYSYTFVYPYTFDKPAVDALLSLSVWKLKLSFTRTLPHPLYPDPIQPLVSIKCFGIYST